jgi:hypothetical protein
MIIKDDPVVQFKLKILEKSLPAHTAIVLGDMWKVEGFYTKSLIDMGCKRVVLVDTLETPNWLNMRLKHPNIDFYKGDFSNSLFMKSINEKFDIAVAYDILLHQPPLLSTIHLILEKVAKRLCVVQPMLREQKFSNSLVYLPGNSKELYPILSEHQEYKMFDILQVNQGNWIWGMTASFLNSVLAGEGFKLVYNEELFPLENKNWFWGGYIYKRRYENSAHWANTKMTPGLYSGEW